MKYELRKEKEVVSSLVDINLELGLIGAQSIVQDNMCDYFKLIGADGPTMVPKCNCFFVVSKSKIKFNKMCKWQDGLIAESMIVGKSRIKLNLLTRLKDGDGNIVAECMQEMVPIDATTRSIKMLSDTLVPEDLEVSGESDMAFNRLVVDYEDVDACKVVAVDSGNVDFYKHTNNIEYIKMMLSSLSVEYLASHQIVEFEINYVTESRAGDVLTLYRKELDDGKVAFQLKRGNDVVTRALLSVCVRENRVDLF